MSEKIYGLLLALYPAHFRHEYGAAARELLRDRMRAERGRLARARLWLDLLGDIAVSVPREYQRRETPLAASPAEHAFDGVPLFYSCGDDVPRRGALIHGGLLSIAVFAAVTYLINHGGSRSMFVTGSHHPSPSHFLAAQTAALPASELDSEIKVRPYPDKRPISAYFRMMPVLSALDADQDGILSAYEIAHAAAALRTLDKNRDGKLTPEECGLHLPDSFQSDSRLVYRIRLEFMQFHPVLAALDADHDGEISAREIENAPAALRVLDRNGDGSITENEVLPPLRDR